MCVQRFVTCKCISSREYLACTLRYVLQRAVAYFGTWRLRASQQQHDVVQHTHVLPGTKHTMCLAHHKPPAPHSMQLRSVYAWSNTGASLLNFSILSDNISCTRCTICCLVCAQVTHAMQQPHHQQIHAELAVCNAPSASVTQAKCNVGCSRARPAHQTSHPAGGEGGDGASSRQAAQRGTTFRLSVGTDDQHTGWQSATWWPAS